MIPEVRTILTGLEFRLPMLLRNVEPLNEEQLRWSPAPGRNSIAWQLWHIAEVEDNWPRTVIDGEPPRFVFGVQLCEAAEERYPSKSDLLEYLRAVRELSKERLAAVTPDDLERRVTDPDFGELAVRDVWAGVVTSFAWHAGQIAMTAKMLPDSPVTTMEFEYWRKD